MLSLELFHFFITVLSYCFLCALCLLTNLDLLLDAIYLLPMFVIYLPSDITHSCYHYLLARLTLQLASHACTMPLHPCFIYCIVRLFLQHHLPWLYCMAMHLLHYTSSSLVVAHCSISCNYLQQLPMALVRMSDRDAHICLHMLTLHAHLTCSTYD